MSRGPLPAEVYWRRRFLVLAALFAVAWGVVTVWPDGGDGEPAAAQPSPSPTASASPSASPEPEPSAKPESQETTVSLAAGGDPCDPETIRMSPHVPPDQTAKGKVTIQLSLSTTADEPCTFRPKPGELVAVVSQDDTAVWDSDVCSTARLMKGAVALSPQWSTVAEATWSGRGSGPLCSEDEGWASPGKYALRIGTLGGEPGKTTFQLNPKPKKEKSEDSEESEEPAEDDSDDSDDA